MTASTNGNMVAGDIVTDSKQPIKDFINKEQYLVA